MGTNSLITVTGGSVIDPGDNNNINEALSEDFVPRNVSGVATNDAGALGTSSFFWSAVYSAVLNLSNSASISYTSGPEKMSLELGGAEVASLLETGFEPFSMGPRSVGTESLDAGVKNMSISEIIGNTSTGTDEEFTQSDVIITSKGGPVMVGFVGAYDSATGGGIYGTSGGERFRIKNVTSASIITGQLFVSPSASRQGFGAYTQILSGSNLTPNVAQTLRVEAQDVGVTISQVRMFAMEL